MTKKHYAINFTVKKGRTFGPSAWSAYPAGVELLAPPFITCTGKECKVRLQVLCTEEVGKLMKWELIETPVSDPALQE